MDGKTRRPVATVQSRKGCGWWSVHAFQSWSEVPKVSNEKNREEKRDALARNNVHWAGQQFIPANQIALIIVVFNDDGHRSHIRPCHGVRPMMTILRMMGTCWNRSRT
jgi:hypothetical protein